MGWGRDSDTHMHAYTSLKVIVQIIYLSKILHKSWEKESLTNQNSRMETVLLQSNA